jgi:hypothetical protein
VSCDQLDSEVTVFLTEYIVELVELAVTFRYGRDLARVPSNEYSNDVWMVVSADTERTDDVSNELLSCWISNAAMREDKLGSEVTTDSRKCANRAT